MAFFTALLCAQAASAQRSDTGEGVELRETAACAAGEKEVKALDVRLANFERIIQGETTRVTLLEEQGCLKIGGTLRVDAVVRELPSRKILSREEGPEVEVVGLKGVPVEKLSAASGNYVRKKLERTKSALKSRTIVFLTMKLKAGSKWKRKTGHKGKSP